MTIIFGLFFLRICSGTSKSIKCTIALVVNYKLIFLHLKYIRHFFPNVTSATLDCTYDGIVASVIKASCDSIVNPLSDLINCSLQIGCCPKALKVGKVIPILKSGDSSTPSNYRPISILPSFSKIFEYVIMQRLTRSFLKLVGLPSKINTVFKNKRLHIWPSLMYWKRLHHHEKISLFHLECFWT